MNLQIILKTMNTFNLIERVNFIQKLKAKMITVLILEKTSLPPFIVTILC